MAETKATVSPRTAAVERDMTTMAFVAPIVGWLIPGAGHFIQRRWLRGAILLVCIFAMFFLGLMMEGHVYSPNTGDILDILGFIGDIGAGGLYFLARSMDWGQGAIHKAVADYGTKYIIVAGLLNIVCIVDAYHIAIGKKP
jgi:peptidoglycan/LPS O-acetylase OafA/YrhL